MRANQYIGIFYGGDVFFKNNLTGYLSDNNSTVLKSIDGGNTWNEMLSHGRSIRAANIAVTGDGKAFFVNNYEDSIYRTLDGGINMAGYNLGGAKISDIFFSDNNAGLCSTDIGLFSTTNGGNSWNNIIPLTGLANNSSSGLFMFDNTTAWVIYNNKVLHANGNFSTWHLDSVATTINLTFSSVYATSATVVYISSVTGFLYKSTDGGTTFNLLKKLDNVWNSQYISDIHFVNATTGYMSLGSRIYKTIDSGNTWSVIVALASTDIIEIHFSDATHGWACCFDGTVLKYN